MIKRESKMRALLVLMFALLLAPLAQAQEVTYIGCDIGSGGLACTETPYGNGDTGPPADLASVGDLPRGSLERLFVGPGDGSCGVPSNPPVIPLTGQIRLREIDSCVVSSTNRCEIEIPQRIADSGFFLSVVILFDLGPLGLAALSANTLEDVGRAGNVGHRQLNGTCTNDGGEECSLDSDCASGTTSEHSSSWKGGHCCFRTGMSPACSEPSGTTTVLISVPLNPGASISTSSPSSSQPSS